MDKNTKEYLNSRTWYRLLKIFYLVIFLVVTIRLIGGMIISEKPQNVIDEVNSKIVCNNGSTYPLDNKKLSTDIVELCGGKVEFEDSESGRKVNLDKNYEIKYAYKVKGSWSNVAIFLIIIIISTLSIFEIVRRIFYYVALGAFKPKK